MIVFASLQDCIALLSVRPRRALPSLSEYDLLSGDGVLCAGDTRLLQRERRVGGCEGGGALLCYLLIFHQRDGQRLRGVPFLRPPWSVTGVT